MHAQAADKSSSTGYNQRDDRWPTDETRICEAPSVKSDAHEPPAPVPARRRALRLALRASFSVLVFLVALESMLRAIGFKYHKYISRVQYNQSIAILAEFNRDPYLIWAPKPDSPPFNRLGYIGPELPRDRTPGTLRIACLGDSCTMVGSPAYPEIVARLLEERGHRVEVMNWGVAGYSSFQGLKRLERDVIPFRPDIITIYFGWNDHWIQAGFEDDPAAVAARRMGPIRRTIQETRTAQAVALVAETVGRRPETPQFRVPLAAYREYLREIIRLAHAHDARVLLITAPGCLIDDRPLELHLKGLDVLGYTNAAAVHADYLAATRQVADETHAALFDAAHYFANEIDGCSYFLPDRDPVHLTQPGLEKLAEQLAEELIQSGLLK